MSDSNAPAPGENPLIRAGKRVHKFIFALNSYSGLLNVMLGVIGALFLVNEWEERQEDARMKAIEALAGSATQSRAALAYLTRISANLSHQDLSGVNVSGLTLTDAGLSDARFDNSNLINATLEGDLGAVSLRCADISNLSLENRERERGIDARAARVSMQGASVKEWKSPVIYSDLETLQKLSANVRRKMTGEIEASEFFAKQPGAQKDGNLPYCLYERLKSQGASHETLCRGGLSWDGISCE